MMDDAITVLSKWWRARCREEHLLQQSVNVNRDGKLMDKAMHESQILFSPTSKIAIICQRKDATQYLRQEANKLNELCKKLRLGYLPDLKQLAELSYIHGTFLELLHDHTATLSAYRSAYDNAFLASDNCFDKMTLSLYLSGLRRVELGLEMEALRNQFQNAINTQNRDQEVSKQCTSNNDGVSVNGYLLAPSLPSPLPISHSNSVDVISYGSLTYKEFIESYALKNKPLIFTGAASKILPNQTWNMKYLCEHIKQPLPIKKATRDSVEWAQQELVGDIYLSDFTSKIDCNDANKQYLVDWSLPQNCPSLLEDFHVPIYFAGDILQTAHIGSIYRDSWPSLFIGSVGSQSKLHIDTFGSHFWMLLLSGRKRWIFYPREEIHLLYPCYDFSFDPYFSFDPLEDPLEGGDNDSPGGSSCNVNDGSKKYKNDNKNCNGSCPLSKYAHPYEVILNPGELIFVPAGCPHCVVNLDATAAISGNYIDSSNFDYALTQLDLAALKCSLSESLAAHLRGLPPSLKLQPQWSSSQEEIKTISWAEYKSGTIWARKMTRVEGSAGTESGDVAGSLADELFADLEDEADTVVYQSEDLTRLHECHTKKRMKL